MKKKNANLLISTLISLLSMIDITNNLIEHSANVIGIKSNDYIVNFLSNLFISIGKNSNISFIFLTIFTYLIISHINRKQISSWHLGLVFVFSTIMSLFANIGILIRATGPLNNTISTLVCCKLFIKTIAFSCLITFVFLFLEQKCYQLNFLCNRADPWPFQKIITIMFILWLPYYVILFPGTGSFDTINQLLEAFGQGFLVRDVYPIGHYLLTAHPSSISNQHNFFMTLILGMLTKIGLIVFHNINYGIAIASFIQMSLVLFSICYALFVLNNIGCQQSITKFLFLFYALFPIFPIYGIYLSKNTFYTASIVLFVSLLIEYCSNKKVIFSKNWRYLVLIDVVLQIISEKYAIYVLFIIFIYLITVYHSFIKEWIKLIFIPIILFQLCVVHIMFTTLQVPNGDPIEGLSVPIQQTALCVKQHNKQLTKSQRHIINKVFILKNLPDLYMPNESDPIKSSGFKNSAFKTGYRYKTVRAKDIRQYKILWFKMMFEFPKTYLEALINLNYQYLDINTHQTNTHATYDCDSFPLAFVNYEIPSRLQGEKTIHQNQQFLPARRILALLFNIGNKIPPISLMLSGTSYIWLAIFCLLVLTNISGIRFVAGFLPVLLQIPVIMLSPIDNSQRYMYPIIFSSLLLMGIMFTIISKKSSSK